MLTLPARPRLTDPGTAAGRLISTPLWGMGGAALVRLLDESGVAALRREADLQAATATEMRLLDPPPDSAPNGNPDRWLDSSAGGPLLDDFYRHPSVLAVLARVTGLRWQPTGERGAYSYYRRPGHHLGLHRDIDTCELAVITCLRDDGPRDGGILRLYPGRWQEPLGAIRETPDDGAVEVGIGVGESLMLLGGLAPHLLTAVGPGRVRVIAPLCYRLAA